MAELPTGTVTFLFTDIEGSTQLVDQLRDRYGDLQAAHQQLLRAAFAEAGGHEIDTQGDAFFVGFRRARDAVAAAVAGQRALADHEWPEGVEVRVRMGIHTDEPGVAEDRYHGLGVVRAARICSAGHGQQILLSNATRTLLDEEELPGASLRDLGEHRLKGLRRPERIFQLVLPGFPEEFPPLKTLGTEPIPLAGREQEFAEAARAAIASRPSFLFTRRRVLVAVGAFVLAGAVVASLFETTRNKAAPVVQPNSLAVIDPQKDKVVDVVSVGNTPTAVAVGAGSVWVLNSNEESFSQIDLEKRTIANRFVATGPAPTDLAAEDDAVWVATMSFRLTEVDAGSRTRVRTITLPVSPNPLAAGASASWVAVRGKAVWATGDSTVTRIAPTPARHAAIGGVVCCNGIAIGAGSVWVTDQSDILRINARTGQRQASIPLGSAGSHIAVGAGLVWVSHDSGSTISVISPSKNEVLQTISVGDQPQGIAVGAGSVWVASADGTVSRIDPKRLRVAKSIVVGGTPSGIAVGRGKVWVSVD